MTFEETQKYVDLPFFTSMVYPEDWYSNWWHVDLNLRETKFRLEISKIGMQWAYNDRINGFLVGKKITFQYVFENSPKHIQEQLLFYLDLFR